MITRCIGESLFAFNQRQTLVLPLTNAAGESSYRVTLLYELASRCARILTHLVYQDNGFAFVFFKGSQIAGDTLKGNIEGIDYVASFEFCRRAYINHLGVTGINQAGEFMG